MGEKPFYLSKTLWANVIAFVLGFAAKQAGVELDAEVAVAVLATVNAMLRLVTKDELRLA